MTGISFDVSEVRQLAVDFSRVGAIVAQQARPVVSKGALNIKTAMQADMKGSEHFKGAAHTVSYDLLDGGFTAEIGPSSEAGSPGNLANLAYFGGSNGGGGTVADPRTRLDEELPKFEKALLDIAAKAFQ